MRVIVVSALAIGACGGAHSQANPDAGADSAGMGHVDRASLPQAIGGAAWVDPDAYATIDERHGGSVTTPRPEVYFETVWN